MVASSQHCTPRFPAIIMDTDTKQEAYHSSAYVASGAAMMSFEPINQIHQHICAFHCYACVFSVAFSRYYDGLTYPCLQV